VTEVEQWVRQLIRGEREARAQAEAQLRGLGEEVVPELHRALEAELRKTQGLILSYDPVLRLAEVLAARGDRRSLPLLIRVAQLRQKSMSNTDHFIVPLYGLLQQMEARADAKDCAALIEILVRFRQQPLHSFPTGSDFLLGWSVQQVALTLIRIAERDPKPELRVALPLLRYSFFSTPLDLMGLHKRLKAVLGSEDLPLPATPPEAFESLPIPTTSEENP
jgi:hypothetical protein